jgi:hypothetical protein
MVVSDFSTGKQRPHAAGSDGSVLFWDTWNERLCVHRDEQHDSHLQQRMFLA